MATICAKDLKPGDTVFHPVYEGKKMVIVSVETRTNVPDPEVNTYDEVHDKVYADVTVEGVEGVPTVWLWPDQELQTP